jgi:hypothetical protein
MMPARMFSVVVGLTAAFFTFRSRPTMTTCGKTPPGVIAALCP